MEEILEIYDNNLKKIGFASRKEVHQQGLLHAVSHLWITDIQHQRLYLQQRSLKKDAFPGYYDISTAGHIDPNETPTEAILREAKEEIGLELKASDLNFLGCIIEQFGTDHEIAYIYTCDIANPPFILGEEVTDMFYMDFDTFFQENSNKMITSLHGTMQIISQKKICPHDTSLLKNYLMPFYKL